MCKSQNIQTSCQFLISLNRQAEARIAALERTFATYQSDQPDIAQHMRAEADAIEQLSRLKTELDKYQRTYGPLSTHSPDVTQLVEKLRSKEEELENLRLLEKQRKEVCKPIRDL